ncbi:MAG: trypsin-like serine protease, partial [Clostridiales bacterium]|nr:trypsin-like serine protease [Clostridiales bacterium]
MNEFENNGEFTSEDPQDVNTAEETTAENTAEETAENQNTENNTTYHYSYTSKNNQNQNPYYNPNPQQSYTQTYNTGQINYAETPAPKQKNKTVITLVVIFIVCACLAIAGLFAAAVGFDKNDNNNNTETTNPSAQVEAKDQETVPDKSSTGEYTVKGVVDKVINSCVGITVYTEATNYSNFYGYGSQKGSGEQIQSGAGSGVLMLESNGKTYVLTNAHVISDGSKFKVTLNDKTEYEAKLVGYDSQTDIGVLSIDKTGLQIAEFGKSDQTVQGEQVVAIGCPGGLDFLNSSSIGYVSALARPIQSTIGYNTECIQIDASINPGNSGGGLFNMQGQVIGINSSKIAATEYEGMGFAIPSNTAIATANSLI